MTADPRDRFGISKLDDIEIYPAGTPVPPFTPPTPPKVRQTSQGDAERDRAVEGDLPDDQTPERPPGDASGR